MGSDFDKPKAAASKIGPPKKTAKAQGKDRDLGAALRSAYQKTVDEAVPDEMLDLLGKLN